MNTSRYPWLTKAPRLLGAAVVLLACSGTASATSLNFTTDPFAGFTVRNIPGRQVVGGESFLSFDAHHDTFSFDAKAFNMSRLQFANSTAGGIPSSANVIVLETTDNDNNPLTPFSAGNAADLIASRVTRSGPGLFVYFNQSLNLPRLVYSDDLSRNNADLRILARILELNLRFGQAAFNEMQTFSAANFDLTGTSPVPEPSTFVLLGASMAALAFGVARRRPQVPSGKA